MAGLAEGVFPFAARLVPTSLTAGCVFPTTIVPMISAARHDAPPGAGVCQGEKPHQGVRRKNPAPHRGITHCKSRTALGLPRVVRKKCSRKIYRARYYDPSNGRFLNEDPLGFGGGLNFYSYVGNDPVDLIDPSGLKMSRAECDALRRGILKNAYSLAKDIAKYDPISDGAGGHKMRWGTGWTKPGTHYNNDMAGFARGIVKDAARYWKECRNCDHDNNPRLPEWVFEQVREYRQLPPPVIPVRPLSMDELGIHPNLLPNWRNLPDLNPTPTSPLVPTGVPGILGVLGRALGAL